VYGIEVYKLRRSDYFLITNGTITNYEWVFVDV